MVFTFEIPDDEWFGSADMADVKECIIDKATKQLTNEVLYTERNITDKTVKLVVESIIRENEQDIIKNATDKVVNAVLKKKEIAGQMPKASDIKEIDKEWNKYFKDIISKEVDKSVKAKFKNLFN